MSEEPKMQEDLGMAPPLRIGEKELEALDRIFLPISEKIEKRINRPVFFLTLHPQEYQIVYCGIVRRDHSKDEENFVKSWGLSTAELQDHVELVRAISLRKFENLMTLEDRGIGDIDKIAKDTTNIVLAKCLVNFFKCFNNAYIDSARVTRIPEDLMVEVRKSAQELIAQQCRKLAEEELSGRRFPLHQRGSVDVSVRRMQGNWRISQTSGPFADDKLIFLQDVLDFAHVHALQPARMLMCVREEISTALNGESGAPPDFAVYDFSARAFDEKNKRDLALVVVVPYYHKQRPKLGGTADEQRALLAEFIYGCDEWWNVEPKLIVKPSEISHYFLPIAALGQYRAAACWLTPGPGWTGEKEITLLFTDLLNELCSFAIIDEFGRRFLEILSGARREQTAGPMKAMDRFIETFSILWWSQAIALYFWNGKNYEFLSGFTRIEDCTLKPPSDVEEEEKYFEHLTQVSEFDTAGRFLTVYQRGPENERDWPRTFIIMNLDVLGDGETVAREQLRESIDGLLGFRRVVFEVKLLGSPLQEGIPDRAGIPEGIPEKWALDRQTTNRLKGYGQTLCQEMTAALRFVQKELRLSRTEFVHAVAHLMKNSLNATRWTHALNALSEFAEGKDLDPHQIAAIADIRFSLSGISVVFGLANLVRLSHICVERQYEKLAKDWTDVEQLKHWLHGDSDILVRYTRFCAYVAQIVAYGDGLPGTSHIRLAVLMQGQQTLHQELFSRIRWDESTACSDFGAWIDSAKGQEMTDFPVLLDTQSVPIPTVEQWIRDNDVNLSPFHCETGRFDAHYAIMAALYEPLKNAVRAAAEVEGGDVFIVISHRKGELVTCFIGNDSQPLVSGETPSGISQTRELLAETQLATLDVMPPMAVDGHPCIFWTRVDLHPQRLAYRILESVLTKEQLNDLTA